MKDLLLINAMPIRLYDGGRGSWCETAAIPVKIECTLQSKWMEYVGRSKRGTLLTNMEDLLLRASNASWSTQSHVLRPWTVAKSNGPWIKISLWVRLTQQQTGTRCWCKARFSDVSEGVIRWVSMVPNVGVVWPQYCNKNHWFVALNLTLLGCAT